MIKVADILKGCEHDGSFIHVDEVKRLMEKYASAVIDACAESAETKNVGTYSSSGEAVDHFIVDKESILKLKKQLK